MAIKEDPKEKTYPIEGFEQMQIKTSRFIRNKGHLELVQNGQYDEIGSIGKKQGYAQRGSALTSTTSTSSSSSTTTSSSTSTTSTSTSTTTTA
jgi:hypothetical protein